MAVYRIGDMLRMKREALGITREKLCELSEDICSPQTLYRMECGKVKVKQEVYRRLMECMGELPERNYASVIVSNYKDLHLKKEIGMHMFRGEYEKAEEKLEQLEKSMDTSYVRNKQYMGKMKIDLKNKLEENRPPEEYLNDLWDLLRLTIPNLNQIDMEKWPYNGEEYSIICTILGTYTILKWREKEEELLLKLIENNDKRYIEEDYYIARGTNYLDSLSQVMSITNQHERAINYCKDGIEKGKKQRLLASVYHFLYDMVWNREQMIKKEMLPKKERESCKRLLVQAYYISVACKEDYHSERIKKLCDKLYPEEIKFYL